jgi:hypothetical protein
MIAVSPPRDALELPLTPNRPKAPDVETDFGAASSGLSTRCLRFAGRVATAPRKTRFRLVANLCRAGLSEPAGFHVKFQPWSTSAFSSPKLCLAQTKCSSRRARSMWRSWKKRRGSWRTRCRRATSRRSISAPCGLSLAAEHDFGRALLIAKRDERPHSTWRAESRFGDDG